MGADTNQATAACLGLICLVIIFITSSLFSALGISLVIAGAVLSNTVMWAVGIPFAVLGIAGIACSCICCKTKF